MGPSGAVLNGIVVYSACSGCKYYSNCGDGERLEPCEGWERAYSVNPLDDIDWDEDDDEGWDD